MLNIKREFWKNNYSIISVCVVTCLLLVLKPTQVPALWYDEGFVLSLARNWVVLGHYGHLLLGQPVPAIASTTGFPVVAPVALSFRLFGIGEWQARLPGIIYSAAALTALLYLAYKLYSKQVAFITLTIVILFSSTSALHPVIVGRQSLGEIPAMFYMLTGYIFYIETRVNRKWPLGLAVVFWAIALQTKPQIMPFLFVSFTVPLIFTIRNHQRSATWWLAASLLGTVAAFILFTKGLAYLQSNQSLSPKRIVDIYDQALEFQTWLIYWIVLVPVVRLGTFIQLLTYNVPLLVSVGYQFKTYIINKMSINWDSTRDTCKFMLFIFTLCWVAWYALLSIGWARYVFPAVFIGSVFIAVMLNHLIGSQNILVRLVQLGAGIIHSHKLSLSNFGILILAIFIPFSLMMTVINVGSSFIHPQNDDLRKVTSYLNYTTPNDSIIETTEFELFFMTERPYHYPPSAVVNNLNRRSFLGLNPAISYDPLESDPDYLVVGRMGHMWKLYDSVTASGDFKLVTTFGDYQIYQRTRSN